MQLLPGFLTKTYVAIICCQDCVENNVATCALKTEITKQRVNVSSDDADPCFDITCLM